jgi:hypothetical protein
MKFTDTHLLSDLLKVTNSYRGHQKLFLTKKVYELSKNIKLKNEDSYSTDFFEDEDIIKDFDVVLGMINEKKLLIVTENENIVYDFSYDGNVARFITIVWVQETSFKLVVEFERSLENRSARFIGLDIQTGTKGKKLLGQSLFEDEHFTITDFLLTQHFLIIKYIIFIELSKDNVSYKTILPKSKVGHILKGDLFKNETKHSITQVDSLWNIESVNIGEFKVRGHFRLQRCGVGFSEVKLIYINEFKKTHYIRTRTRDLTYTD